MIERQRKDTRRIAEEAAEWLEALEDDEADTRAFAAWLRASPRHVEEFLLMKTLDTEAAHIDPQRNVNVEQLLAEVTRNVVPLRETAPTRSSSADQVEADAAADTRSLHRPRLWSVPPAGRWAAVAAGLTLAIASWWMFSGPGRWESFTTGIGEQRAVELDDGSIIQLNARSRLKVHLSAQQRSVRLIDGEALFKVARDSTRPFRVLTVDTMIQAVGTQFNVYRRKSDTTVSVLEGKVKIARIGSFHPSEPIVNDSGVPRESALLSAGEEARIVPNGELIRSASDVAVATAWRQRRLIFRDNSLAEIADEFNRYNRNLRITVQGDALRARRYGGTFDADDPESLVDFLRPDEELMIERSGEAITIRLRPDDINSTSYSGNAKAM